ncbi:decaprenyl-phosphate phosphoribosyltransferase [Sphaerimonospora sp. CA-214678]|uniref:decaprenyl-phosphate phosphoribosyltransferase n=1 Tax=Sphaerimonospora sp. CA-214678 TaxID=3240029 RepID=UPI003D8F1AE0
MATTSTEAARPGTAMRSQAAGLLRACRPRQWLKNALVFAAPAAAGVLTTGAGLRGALIAFAAFCLAASGTYLFNDAADVAADRRHPRKRLRPIAAGIVPVRLAQVVGSVLLGLGLLVALSGGPPLGAVVAAYLALTFAYTRWLKHQPVVDLVAIACCHVIRAYAGAVAVAVSVTGWFLVVVSLGSLLIVAGKREAELRASAHKASAHKASASTVSASAPSAPAVGGAAAGGTAIGGATGGTRATLAVYTPGYLAHVRAMASGAMIVTYCLWALQEHTGAAKACYALSIAPLVLIVLRHALLVDRGVGEEPEELALGDRPLQVFAGLMLFLLALGMHLS